MKRIVRLTENDLARIVRRVINEAPTSDSLGDMKVGGQYGSDTSATFSGVFSSGELVNTRAGYICNFSEYSKGIVYSGVISMTPEGTALGLAAGQFTFPDGFPKTLLPLSSIEVEKGAKARNNKGQIVAYKMSKTPINLAFTVPSTAKKVISKDTHIANITYTTNDTTKPTQVIKVWMKQGTQFGVAGASRN